MLVVHVVACRPVWPTIVTIAVINKSLNKLLRLLIIIRVSMSAMRFHFISLRFVNVARTLHLNTLIEQCRVRFEFLVILEERYGLRIGF